MGAFCGTAHGSTLQYLRQNPKGSRMHIAHVRAHVQLVTHTMHILTWESPSQCMQSATCVTFPQLQSKHACVSGRSTTLQGTVDAGTAAELCSRLLLIQLILLPCCSISGCTALRCAVISIHAASSCASTSKCITMSAISLHYPRDTIPAVRQQLQQACLNMLYYKVCRLVRIWQLKSELL